MTPYSVSSIVERQHLIIRSDGSTNGVTKWFQTGHLAKPASTCITTVDAIWNDGDEAATWKTATHTPWGINYDVNCIDSSEISDAIATVENDVATSALTEYDVLTDIAEAREIPGLISSLTKDVTNIYRLLHGRFSLRDLRRAAHLTPRQLKRDPSRVLREIGDRWMEYRYGIMPIVYSIHDIAKMVNRGFSIHTRKRKIVRPRNLGTSLPSSTTEYQWTDYVGDVTISGTVFQRYTSSLASQLSSLGFNPLVTAWELIPYSFVADWFVGVGDYICRATTSNLASRTMACISQRSNYTKRQWMHLKQDNKTVTYTRSACTGWVGSLPPTSPSGQILRPEESQLFKETTTDAYVRWLFALNDARLTIRPSINWRRMIDGSVMTLNHLGAFIRHLKG